MLWRGYLSTRFNLTLKSIALANISLSASENLGIGKKTVQYVRVNASRHAASTIGGKFGYRVRYFLHVLLVIGYRAVMGVSV